MFNANHEEKNMSDDYYSEAFGAEARAIADHENYMNEIHDKLIANVRYLQNVYNRSHTCYSALQAAKAELAEFEASR
jgi:hypothetical protein